MLSGRTFLTSLSENLESRIDKTILEEENKDIYINPNWNLLQADNRGYRRALREVLKMFIKTRK